MRLDILLEFISLNFQTKQLRWKGFASHLARKLVNLLNRLDDITDQELEIFLWYEIPTSWMTNLFIDLMELNHFLN